MKLRKHWKIKAKIIWRLLTNNYKYDHRYMWLGPIDDMIVVDPDKGLKYYED